MRLNKFFCGALAAAMLMFAPVNVSAAADESANSKLMKIESDTYGAEQSGAILDRISRLEKDFSGRNMSGNMNARIEAIYDILYNNDAGPGILAKLNALEWNVNHEVAIGGINSRITALENAIVGNTTAGTFNERIRALAKASYGAEILPISQVQIPENTLIKIATTAPVGSKFMQEGDTVPVKVIEDVFVDGCLVFAKGLPGEGNVVNVRRARNIFSNGKLEIDFNRLQTIDGQDAKICVDAAALDEMTANAMGRGLSLVGQTFSGKHKEVEEVLIRGKNIDLPAGIELYVQIRVPIVVYGVKADVNGLLLDEMITDAPVDEMTTETVDRVETVPNSEPMNDSSIEARPDEGKTLDGYDGEIIEVIDD